MLAKVLPWGMDIAIVNGPNLNLLGQRQPEIYGHRSLQDYWPELKAAYPDVAFSFFQSNHEGELIDYLHEVGFVADGVVLNAGALSHTSIALGDAVAAIAAPVLEVHISNVMAREAFRQHSYISAPAVGCIMGLGLAGYGLAVQYLVQRTAKQD
jgi:3-dehydroquinate dehydratase II